MRTGPPRQATKTRLQRRTVPSARIVPRVRTSFWIPSYDTQPRVTASAQNLLSVFWFEKREATGRPATIMRFTLKQIEYFAAAAETGSITHASEQVYISQPSISSANSTLEAEFGI